MRKIHHLLCFTLLALMAFTTPATAQKSSLTSGSVLPVARVISPFQLIDNQGHAFTEANLKNQWSMMFFGFTRCQTICPKTLAILNAAYEKIAAAKPSSLPQIIFVSVDPERDTPAKVDQYVKAFNSHFRGATGDQKQLQKLTAQLHVMFAKVPTRNNAHYDIDHSGTILIFNPQGKLYAVFTSPHDADNIAQDFQTMIK